MESDDVVTFCQSDLPSISYAIFGDMRKKGELCDFTIKVKNNSITAHRVVLAAAIPYFRSLLTSGEVDNKGAEIYVGNLDPGVLESLIDFAYSSRVNITAQNVQSLLQASQFLHLDQVLEACVEFLSKRFRSEGIWEIYTLANDLNNMNLIEKSKRYILKNFEEFSKSEDFLALPHSCLKEMISDDDLNVPTEEVLFEAVINWVKISPSERHVLLPELLHEVRMVHLPTDYLVTRVECQELVRTSIPCRDLVNEVKSYHLAKNKSVFPNLKTKHRKWGKSGICGVRCNNRIKECSIYYSNFISGTWQNISTKVLRKSTYKFIYHVVAVNDKLFIFFGETIVTFHLNLLEWEELDARHSGTDFSSILSCGNTIYCFGSYEDCLSGQVRRFDTTKNIWLIPRSMKTARWGSSAVTLENCIYVTGGRTKETYLTTVERYDPSRYQWTDAAPMLTPRRSHGCTAFKGNIYVCGGFTRTGRSCTAEMYDSLTDQWKYISSMAIKRSSPSILSYRGKIYALGGLTDDESCVQEIEIYNPETDEWKSSFHLPKDVDKNLIMRAVLAIPNY